MNTTIRAKIIQFQKNMPLITKNANNPYFKSEYATLDAIQASIQQPLADAWLWYMQTVTSDWLVTTIFDEDGNYLDSTYPLSLHGKPQEIASGVTYAKRYALTAMLWLIVSWEDDDGNKANTSQIIKTEKSDTIWLSQDQYEKTMQADAQGIQAVLDTYDWKEKNGKKYGMKKARKEQLENRLQELQNK